MMIVVMPFVMAFVVLFVMGFVLGFAVRLMPLVRFAVAERYSAERQNHTTGQDRYENAACNGHNVPLIWDGLLGISPIFVPTKMRQFPFAPGPHRPPQPAKNIDYVCATRRGRDAEAR
jgi:hypothetical protein